MKRAFLALCILFFTSAGFAEVVVTNRKTSAAASKTDDVYAPLYRQHEISLRGRTLTGHTQSSTAGVKTTTTYSGYDLQVSYAYGVADYFSLYGAQVYQDLSNSTASSSSKSVGIGDTTVGAKGIINRDKKYLYYNGTYTQGLAAKAQNNTSSGESTAVSTRPLISLGGGGGIMLDRFGFGASANYLLYQDGDYESTTGSVKTTTKYRSGTGLDWKVYGQLDMRWKLGLSYQERKTDEYNTVTAGVTSITDTSTNTYITGYGIYPITQSVEAMLSASKLDNKEATTTTYNIYIITAGIKFIL